MTISVLLPKSILEMSPSRQIGIPEDIEYEYRIFGCQLIREACIRLKLSCVVSASGQVLFQRFYYKRTLYQYHPFFVAISCLYLATKCEEEPIHIGRIIRCFYLLFLQRHNQELKMLDRNDLVYISWNKKVIMIEQLILYMNEYRLLSILDHPHRFILLFIKKIEGTKEMAQEAWNICNDLLCTDVSLRFSSHTIASAAISLASEKSNKLLPPCVFELFSTTQEEVNQVKEIIKKLYSTQSHTWLPSITQYINILKSNHPDQYSSIVLKESNYSYNHNIDIPIELDVKENDIIVDLQETTIDAPTLNDLNLVAISQNSDETQSSKHHHRSRSSKDHHSYDHKHSSSRSHDHHHKHYSNYHERDYRHRSEQYDRHSHRRS